jgi:predicted DNA-binding transcriptional regulator YafY
MRRADRLFTIVQLLRGGRYVTAHHLAERLEVSERTIYRDVDELTLCGVPIEGEAGRGFRLPKMFEIPPLMFERNEIEALVVGARLVEAWCGPGLAASARSALARIRGVVPAALVADVDEARVFAPRFGKRVVLQNFEIVHRAVSEKQRLVVEYGAEGAVPIERTLRPLGLYFWGKVWTLAAWCEVRNDFRSFRIDRIANPRPGSPFEDEPDKTLDLFLARARAQYTERLDSARSSGQ